jgi:hypothetical protein
MFFWIHVVLSEDRFREREVFVEDGPFSVTVKTLGSQPWTGTDVEALIDPDDLSLMSLKETLAQSWHNG